MKSAIGMLVAVVVLGVTGGVAPSEVAGWSTGMPGMPGPGTAGTTGDDPWCC